MTIQELQTAIEQYPSSLATALTEVATIEQVIQAIKSQIALEEQHLASASHDEERLITLENEIALADIKIKKREGETELYYRDSANGGKTTEATIAAWVKCDIDVIQYKKEYLEKKLEREKLLLAQRQKKQYPEIVTSPTLEGLQVHLMSTEMDLITAKNQVEEIKACMRSYQLLVSLFTAGLVKDE